MDRRESIKLIFTGAISLPFVISGCTDALQEDVYSSIGPSSAYKTQKNAMALLYSALGNSQLGGYPASYPLWLNELCTDIMYDEGGGLETRLGLLKDFTWSATRPHEFGDMWNLNYQTINRSNLALEKFPEIDMDEKVRKRITAEARFVRAGSYVSLYYLFGPTPLITSSEVSADANPSRASEDEMISFIEKELSAVRDTLPEQISDAEYGRPTRGAALAVLCKFYLNKKKWKKTAKIAKDIIDLGIYALFDGKKRTDLFAIENEKNSEFIYTRPYKPNNENYGHIFLSRSAPPGYKFKNPPKQNFATNYKVYSDFYNSFHPDDERKDAIIAEYTNTSGSLVKLGKDNVRSFKYQEDNSHGRYSGNDVPVVRYADILLSRAEALNELNGPNQESIELINMVRKKANVPLLKISDFSTKTSLRAHLLKERGWEFHSEAKRRNDLIRMGKFISSAQERGHAAETYHRRYPLPQGEIDVNPNLKQNPGYAGA